MKRRGYVALPLLLSCVLAVAPLRGARARRGARLAVVNVGTRSVALVRRVQAALARYASQRASSALTAALLAGAAESRPPIGAVPSEITRLVAKLRGGRALSGELLFELGRALGADYLLVLKPRRGSSAIAARIYSVHRLRFAPHGYDGPGDAEALARYTLSQIRGRDGNKKRWYKKWWVWVVGAGVAALSVTLVVVANSSPSELRVRISR